ncbi:hypothetical protein M0802_001708 [Mischocyttarus mexicanus]|nr:hypothetical protein M0802_001708 [Mischocyttarus mexicanus]
MLRIKVASNKCLHSKDLLISNQMQGYALIVIFVVKYVQVNVTKLYYREVWPENDSFGRADIPPEEEFLALREIFFADLGGE